MLSESDCDDDGVLCRLLCVRNHGNVVFPLLKRNVCTRVAVLPATHTSPCCHASANRTLCVHLAAQAAARAPASESLECICKQRFRSSLQNLLRHRLATLIRSSLESKYLLHMESTVGSSSRDTLTFDLFGSFSTAFFSFFSPSRIVCRTSVPRMASTRHPPEEHRNHHSGPRVAWTRRPKQSWSRDRWTHRG